MVEHRREHSARSASGRSDDCASRGVLLAHGQGVGVNQSARLQRLLVSHGLHVVCGSLAHQVERSRKPSLVVYTALYGLLHGRPHLTEIVPKLASFAQFHVFPVAAAVAVAPLHYLRHGVHPVHLGRVEHIVTALALRQRTASDTVDSPRVHRAPLLVESLKPHCVGVKGQRGARHPHYFHRSRALEHICYGHVGHVAAPRCRQTAVESHLESPRLLVALKEDSRRALRSHGVATRRPFAYSEQFP